MRGKAKCGCIDGYVLCPEAERLWRRTGEVNAQITAGAAIWADYEKAEAVYNAHMARVRKEEARDEMAR